MKRSNQHHHLSQGEWAEHKALTFLSRNGLRHVTSNYRCAFGELDLVMEHGDCLVFIEVRYRRSSRFGGALASIDKKKQARLRATAEHYLQNHKSTRQRPCRFDVVALEREPEENLRWIQNAF